MLGIYNPEIPVQSAAPISVLLDSAAVPSEVGLDLSVSPGLHLPDIQVKTGWLPSKMLWQQGQPVACAAVASKDTEQELQMGTLAMGGRGQCPLGPGRATFQTLRCIISGEAFRKGHGTRVGNPPSAPNWGEK